MQSMDPADEIQESTVLQADCRYRAGWEKYQREMRERENAEASEEQKIYRLIDWDDLVVVQVVDFQPSETRMLNAHRLFINII